MQSKLVGAVLLFLLLCINITQSLDDPYKVLGITKTASEKEIKRAYKELAKKWHPDKNQDNPNAKEKYVEITDAYEILTDEDKKRKWEQQKYGNSHGQGYGGFGFGNFFFHNPKPIFSETFSITYENFDTFLAKSDEIWVVEFYTDRCEACIEHAPIWEQTARAMGDFARFGRVNGDEQGGLVRHFRVRSIPSIFVMTTNGNVHEYHGRFEANAISEFIKRLLPSNIMQINSEHDFQQFKRTQNSKLNIILFSTHADVISPLYKYVSVKYSYLFNFAQITSNNLDSVLSDQFLVSARPSIVVFSDDFLHRVVVPGPFSKVSLVAALEEHKYIGAPEFHNGNFVHMCGRKSGTACAVAFLNPAATDFRNLKNQCTKLAEAQKDVKVGWINQEKMRHFLRFFNISKQNSDQLQTLLILDFPKRKYVVVTQELQIDPFVKWTHDFRSGNVKLKEMPFDVPPLVELPEGSIFSSVGEFIISVLRFVSNNILTFGILGVALFRVFGKRR